MPYEVGSHPDCPASKPYAVLKSATGERMGCHATVEDADKQMAALYAQEVTMTEKRAAMPQTATDMMAHCCDAPPDGHGMDAADMASMGAADMTGVHDAAHATGASHDHAPMRSARVEGYEVRTAEMWPDADYELRAAPDGLTLEGYAAVFGVPSLPMSFAGVGGGRRFREVIHAGAFTKTLSETPDVTLRYQHNLNALPLARTRSGTMSLEQDGRGLKVRATLPDNEWGRPIRDSIARGDISGMSFRFSKVLDKWSVSDNGSQRDLLEVKLGPEVSITDYPAYPDTSVSVRHLAEEAEVDADALALAFRALREPDAKLTNEQRDLLIHTINTRTDIPVLDSKLVSMRERLAAIA